MTQGLGKGNRTMSDNAPRVNFNLEDRVIIKNNGKTGVVTGVASGEKWEEDGLKQVVMYTVRVESTILTLTGDCLERAGGGEE
jgi:hypothetical protein